MDAKIFNEQHILFDETSQTQDEAFAKIAALVYQCGYVADEKAYYDGLKAREIGASTGFKGHIAVPHAKDPCVIKPGLFLIKYAHDIPWNALDGLPVRVAFALSIPVDGASDHLRMLGQIARKLIDEEFCASILAEMDSRKLEALIGTI